MVCDDETQKHAWMLEIEKVLCHRRLAASTEQIVDIQRSEQCLVRLCQLESLEYLFTHKGLRAIVPVLLTLLAKPLNQVP